MRVRMIESSNQKFSNQKFSNQKFSNTYERVAERLARGLTVATKHDILQYLTELYEIKVLNDLDSILKGYHTAFTESGLDDKFVIYKPDGACVPVIFKRYYKGVIDLTFCDDVDASLSLETGKEDLHLYLRSSITLYKSVSGFASIDDLAAWSMGPRNLEFNRVITNIVEMACVAHGKFKQPTLADEFSSRL